MLVWMITVALLLISLLGIDANWSLVYQKIADGRRGKANTSSFIPLFGGLFGLAGLALAPVELNPWWFLAPFIIDFGSVPYAVMVVVALLRQRFSGSKESEQKIVDPMGIQIENQLLVKLVHLALAQALAELSESE